MTPSRRSVVPGRAAGDDVVQRSVRFDRPGGWCSARSRTFAGLGGGAAAVEPSAGSGGSSSSADVGTAQQPGRDRPGAGSSVESSGPEPSVPPSVARSFAEPADPGPSGPDVRARTVRARTAGPEPFAARPFAGPADSGPSAIRSSDSATPRQPGETGSTPLAAQRSVADAGDPVDGRPDPGRHAVAAHARRSACAGGPAGRALPQLPVVPEQVVARSFVTAPRTADGAAGATGRRGEQRRRAPAAVRRLACPVRERLGDADHRCPRRRPPAARARRRRTGAARPEPGRHRHRRRRRESGRGCVRPAATAPAPPALPDVRRSWPTLRRPRSSHRAPRPNRSTDRRRPRSAGSPQAPRRRRAASGSAPRSPGRRTARPSSSGEAGPVVQMLPAGPAVDVPGRSERLRHRAWNRPARTSRRARPAGSAAEHGADAHVDAGASTSDVPPAAPEPVTPEPVTRRSTTDADSAGSWWPAAPEHATPLLGDRPITTALPPSVTPAVQRSAADDIVPIRWGDPGSPGRPGSQQGGPAAAGPRRATLLQSSGAPAARPPAPPLRGGRTCTERCRRGLGLGPGHGGRPGGHRTARSRRVGGVRSALGRCGAREPAAAGPAVLAEDAVAAVRAEHVRPCRACRPAASASSP